MTDTIHLRSLRGAVRVVRDRLGIPHVSGERRADVYRALGWVMASDRLWQMDLMRRLGLGRVAEVLGQPFLPLDVITRTLGLPEAAATAVAGLAGEAAEALEAFTEGVNGRIESAPAGPDAKPEIQPSSSVPLRPLIVAAQTKPSPASPSCAEETHWFAAT